MVHGDNEQTLRVLVGYYRQKSESLVYESGRMLQDTSKNIHRTSDMNEQIKRELDDERTTEFSQHVEAIYQKYLHHHFNTWNDLSSPLIPSSVILQIMMNFERINPVCASVLFLSITSGRARHKSRYVDPTSLK